MSIYYVAQVETSRPDIDEDLIDQVMDTLQPFHVSIGRTPEGTIQVTLRLPDEAGPVATAQAAATLVGQFTQRGTDVTALPVTGVHVVPERLWDAREDALARVSQATPALGSPPIVTVAAAAADLEVSETMVRRWLSNDILRGERVGGRWAVDPRSIDAMRQRRARRAARAAAKSRS